MFPLILVHLYCKLEQEMFHFYFLQDSNKVSIKFHQFYTEVALWNIDTEYGYPFWQEVS